MAAALQVTASQGKRDKLTIAGTGFAATHAYTATITGPVPQSPDLVLKGTTDGSGDFDLSDVVSIVPNSPGIIKVSVNDGTDTLESTVEVFDS